VLTGVNHYAPASPDALPASSGRTDIAPALLLGMVNPLLIRFSVRSV
jgi:hypothetical protein